MIDTTTNGPERASYLDIAHEEAIQMQNVRVCQEIDRYNEKHTGSHYVRASRKSVCTLHDLAQTNEYVRLLLRRAQDAGVL